MSLEYDNTQYLIKIISAYKSFERKKVPTFCFLKNGYVIMHEAVKTRPFCENHVSKIFYGGNPSLISIFLYETLLFPSEKFGMVIMHLHEWMYGK